LHICTTVNVFFHVIQLIPDCWGEEVLMVYAKALVSQTRCMKF